MKKFNEMTNEELSAFVRYIIALGLYEKAIKDAYGIKEPYEINNECAQSFRDHFKDIMK